MKNYYQPEIETMPQDQILALQDERLVKQVRYVYDHVRFYRDRMDEAGVAPEDIRGTQDLHKLPFITKDDLRDQYPYGLLAVPLEECVRIQSTSGTTGYERPAEVKGRYFWRRTMDRADASKYRRDAGHQSV